MPPVANNLHEVITRDEVEDREAMLRDAFIGIENIYVRLKAQNANDALIESVFDLRYKLMECLHQARDIRTCFPKG